MDKDAHRLARLRTLVVDAGGPAAFVRAYSQFAADKPIDPTYVSQLLNGKRVFGEKSAKNMEHHVASGKRCGEKRALCRNLHRHPK